MLLATAHLILNVISIVNFDWCQCEDCYHMHWPHACSCNHGTPTLKCFRLI